MGLPCVPPLVATLYIVISFCPRFSFRLKWFYSWICLQLLWRASKKYDIMLRPTRLHAIFSHLMHISPIISTRLTQIAIEWHQSAPLSTSIKVPCSRNWSQGIPFLEWGLSALALKNDMASLIISLILGLIFQHSDKSFFQILILSHLNRIRQWQHWKICPLLY